MRSALEINWHDNKRRRSFLCPYVRDLVSGIAASPARELIIALALAGFGIKAGALRLHVWLPLAHPIAPPPAGADGR